MRALLAEINIFSLSDLEKLFVLSSILDCSTNSDSGCLTGHFKEAEDNHLWIIGVFIGVVVVVGMLCVVWRKKKGDSRATSLNVMQLQDESNDSPNDTEAIDGNILRPQTITHVSLEYTYRKSKCIFRYTPLNSRLYFIENFLWMVKIFKYHVLWN